LIRFEAILDWIKNGKRFAPFSVQFWGRNKNNTKAFLVPNKTLPFLLLKRKFKIESGVNADLVT
jgi:hypothetical protein